MTDQNLIGPAIWSAKYLEIPFKDRGYGYDGCHCWGLVYLVYRDELRIELSKYSEYTAMQLRMAAATIKTGKLLEPWRPVKGTWQPFDVVVMKVARSDLEGHVGVATGSGFVLHIEEGLNSVNMPIDHLRIRNRIVGAYRHSAVQ